MAGRSALRVSREQPRSYGIDGQVGLVNTIEFFALQPNMHQAFAFGLGALKQGIAKVGHLAQTRPTESGRCF
jgi:hypothetical protein